MRLRMSRSAAIILAAALLSLVVKGFILDLAVVEGPSMLPRYRQGDVVLVLRCAYGLKAPLGFQGPYFLRWASPRLGEVVVAASPTDGGHVIKRVAETGPLVLKVAGNRLKGGHLDLALEAGEAAVLGPLVQLPDNSVFLLGDNLVDSLDSRSYGAIPVDRLAGRVLGGPLFGPRPPRGLEAGLCPSGGRA